MNAGKHIFSQLVSFLPKRVFDGIVKRHEGDKWVKHFTCWNQLLALMFGVLASVLTWVAGPSKGIFTVGKAGYLPPFFQKTNESGVQRNILLVQGGIVTLLSLLFVVMPSVQSFYQILYKSVTSFCQL